MSYQGVITETEVDTGKFLVKLVDLSGHLFGAFSANTRDEAEVKLSELLRTLHEGQKDGLGLLKPVGARAF